MGLIQQSLLRGAEGIVGSGGLNIDYVVSATALEEASTEVRACLANLIIRGSERAIDEEAFVALRAGLPNRIPTGRPGGSSFNALLALRQLKGDLRLGFFGAAGLAGAGGLIRDAVSTAQIEDPYLNYAEARESGSCLAIEDNGERHLLTTRGANDLVADLVTAVRTSLMDWLSGFRIFHLSSFLDDRSPAALSELIARAKQRNPSLLLSLDPGAHWARSCANDREVMNLLEACDILFVNPEEYQALSACAALDRVKAVVFCKRPESVLVYRQSSASKRIHLELNIDRLPADRIVDTVGAGDVFAAGVLALLHDAPDDYERAAKGGLAAARRKLLAVSLQV